MKYSSYQFITLSVLISFMANPAVAQEGSGGGGESPAESSVSTSSSKKSKAAPEAIESNPVVTVVRAGIDLSTAKDMGIAGVRKIAKAGGSFKNLRHVSKAIANKEVDHTHVDKAIDAGLTGGGDGAGLHFFESCWPH
jgi:pectate lyase